MTFACVLLISLQRLHSCSLPPFLIAELLEARASPLSLPSFSTMIPLSNEITRANSSRDFCETKHLVYNTLSEVSWQQELTSSPAIIAASASVCSIFSERTVGNFKKHYCRSSAIWSVDMYDHFLTDFQKASHFFGIVITTRNWNFGLSL